MSDSIRDELNKHGIKPSSALLTHFKREMFHKVLSLMLDAEFLQAYKHGEAVECADGIKRRLYPRIFTYSADYPEKSAHLLPHARTQLTAYCRVLIATVRDMGACPCPRCLVRKPDLYLLGTYQDQQLRHDHARHDDDAFRRAIRHARNLIYNKGYVVNSNSYEFETLNKMSLVPTEVLPSIIPCCQNTDVSEERFHQILGQTSRR
jgi:hypothetical protein